MAIRFTICKVDRIRPEAETSKGQFGLIQLR